VTAEATALKIAASVAKKLAGERTVRERLIKRLKAKLKEIPDSPSVGWRLRWRLMQLLKTTDAEAALVDQDEQGVQALSAMVASQVLRTDPSPDSLLIAQALMTEYPESLGMEEAFGTLAYKLRQMDANINAQFQRMHDSVDQSKTGADPIDPDVLLAGPLRGLGLLDEYRRIQSLKASDPAGAASALAVVIEQVEQAGYGPLAEPLRLERAQLLTEAGEIAVASAEWLRFVEQFLISGAGPGTDEAVSAFTALAKRSGAPAWLRPRAAAISALEHGLNGDLQSSAVIAAAVAAADAGDPAGAQWLALAAEGATAFGETHLVAEIIGQLRQAADACSDAGLNARLRLVIAEAADDELLWQELLNDAAPGSGRYLPVDSALIHARRGRYLCWRGQSASAAAEFRFGVERGCRAKIYDDAAAWCFSTRQVLARASEVPIQELQELSQQARTLSAAGPGSLRVQAYDPEVTALHDLLESVRGKKRPRAARAELRRYLRDSVTSAHLTDELQAHALLGQMYQQSDRPELAISHYIVAGAAEDASTLASQLGKYFECYAEAQSPQYQRRAAAYATAAAQADLILDELVDRWARSAIAAVQQREGRPFGAEVWREAYKLLDGLAVRLPDELVDDLLADIDQFLPRQRHQYTFVDDQIAGILVGLCAGKPHYQRQIAERVLEVFEVADDIAETLVAQFGVLEPVYRLIEEQLHSLVGPYDVERMAQVRNATEVLVRLGNRSAEVVQAADSFVTKELAAPPAYTANSVGHVAGKSTTATLATSLPVGHRIELARYFADHALDGNDAEGNRATFAAACVPLAEALPVDIRNELFDRLFRLAVGSDEPVSRFDELEKRFGDLFAPFHIERTPGRLRRQVIMTLAILATDQQRQRLVWHAAQLLMRTGESQDALAFARTGYALSQLGYSIELPWRTMALSNDPETRLLAATVLPTSTEQMDFEAAESLARDPNTGVRVAMAASLAGVSNLGSIGIEELTQILRTDASYRVRAELNRP
jgi:hypothetical protein